MKVSTSLSRAHPWSELPGPAIHKPVVHGGPSQSTGIHMLLGSQQGSVRVQKGTPGIGAGSLAQENAPPQHTSAHSPCLSLPPPCSIGHMENGGTTSPAAHMIH